MTYSSDNTSVATVNSSGTVTVVGAGSAHILANCAATANYNAAPQASQSLTVNKAALTVTASAQSKTYGTALSLGTTAFSVGSGLVGSEAVTAVALNANGGTAAADAAGSYTITPSAATGNNGFLASNYNISYATGTLTVGPATLTGTADDKSRAYGQDNPAFTVTYTGFVNGQDASIVTGTLSGSTTADTNSPVGTYPITVSGQSAPNYTINYVAGTLTVTPYALTVTADDQSRAYGDANPTLTGSLAGLENGDNITANYSTAATVTDFVGTYPITVTLADPDGKLANYTVTTNNGTLTITARPITVTAVTDNKIYDGTATSANVPIITAGSLVNGDSATWTQVFNTKDTTANTLIPSGTVSDGNGGNNYNVTLVSIPTMSIHPRGVAAAAHDATRVYGAPNPGFSLDYSGFVAGEDASVLSGTPGLSTTAGLHSNVGDYDINVDTNGVTALNYYLAPAKGKLTITPASARVGVVSDQWTVPPTNSVTFAVAAAPNAPTAVTPSGSVQFIANGTNNLGTFALDGSGAATLSVLGSALAHGSNTITAVFSDPNGNFTGASGDLNPQQVVNIPPNKGTHTLSGVLNKPSSFTAAQLASLDKDADKDPLTIIAVSAAGANGGTVLMAGGTITYTPPANYAGNDSFTYTITDPLGGVTNCTVNVSINLGTATSVINNVYPQPDGSNRVVAYGTPGKTYVVQATSDLVNWVNISTNVAPANTMISVINSSAANYTSRYYRLALQ